jgi:magnesium chelatase subunit D
MTYNGFPFVAIVGQEKIKKALILNLINSKIGGVLISGEKGTAKSTIVRGLAELMEEIDLVNLPLNITEDRLVGGIDIKKAIVNGEKVLDEGVLQKANGNILYIDEVNLLAEQIVNILLEVSSRGENVIEREGLSYCLPSEFILVGSMNPEEGNLRSQFLDRFGLFVLAEGEKEKESRYKIVKRRLDYESDPVGFNLKWDKKTKRLRNQIEIGKKCISKVIISEENLLFSASLASEGKCAGHRAEITLIETAKAIVAFNEKTIMTEDDIEEAAKYVLPHRIREKIEIEESCDADNDEEKQEEQEENDDNIPLNSEIDTTQSLKSSPPTSEEKIEEKWEDIAPNKEEMHLTMQMDGNKKFVGSGKRVKVRTNSEKGRYVKYCFPHEKVTDIALDATIRCAAMHQQEDNGLMITVKKSDLRKKVREQRTGATILFLVDASGSMGAQRRMGAVKGTILSLLNDAYQKRDSIGMIAFRKETAETLLNITRSVDLAQKCLKKLKTGGKSPLALGLYQSYELLKAEKIKNPQALQYLVIVTDGKANIPLFTQDAIEDALNVGKKIANDGINSLVLDTESGYIRYDFAKKLAEEMESDYIKMEGISHDEVEDHVKNFVKKQ